MNCDACGKSNARAYRQTLYGQSERALLCPAHARSRRALGYTLKAEAHEPYQYGVQTTSGVVRYPTRHIAEGTARDWCISPLRTGPRKAELMRRRGWDGEWVSIATWQSPEAQR
jgi:hypothetical protein